MSPDLGVVLLGNGVPVTVLEYAANSCFFDLTWAMIKKVSTHLKVAQPSPDLPSHLRNIIKHVLPNASDEKVAENLAMRSVVVEDPIGDLLPDELVDDMFTGDDNKMFKEHCLLLCVEASWS